MLRLVGYPVAGQLGLPLGDYTDPLAPFVPSAVEFYFVRHQRARRYLLRVEATAAYESPFHGAARAEKPRRSGSGI